MRQRPKLMLRGVSVAALVALVLGVALVRGHGRRLTRSRGGAGDTTTAGEGTGPTRWGANQALARRSPSVALPVAGDAEAEWLVRETGELASVAGGNVKVESVACPRSACTVEASAADPAALDAFVAAFRNRHPDQVVESTEVEEHEGVVSARTKLALNP